MTSILDLHFSIALDRGRYRHPLSLSHCHAQVYSQNGEDGIIAEIFSRISTRDRFFIEIGTENGMENNTRFLLEQGWRGVWVDCDFKDAALRFENFIQSGALVLIDNLITAENINELLDARDIPKKCDFLSIDIDHNTSHVWRALNRRTRVACIEYNSSLPPNVALEVPYDPTVRWDGTNWFGASLKTLEHIAGSKEMALVGCELVGANAFFVNKSEAIGRFQEPFLAETHWEPARYGLVTHIGHPSPQSGRRWRDSDGL